MLLPPDAAYHRVSKGIGGIMSVEEKLDTLIEKQEEQGDAIRELQDTYQKGVGAVKAIYFLGRVSLAMGILWGIAKAVIFSLNSGGTP